MILLALLALNGSWQQGCRNGYSREEIFSGAGAAYVERNFGDPACTQPFVITTSRGVIELGAPVAQPSGASALDFTFESVALNPVAESAAAAWRERAVCGIADWQAGVERDVTGKSCDFGGAGFATPVPKKGDRRYGIVKRSGNALFFGRLSPESDGSAPERRPLELDPSPYLNAP